MNPLGNASVRDAIVIASCTAAYLLIVAIIFAAVALLARYGNLPAAFILILAIHEIGKDHGPRIWRRVTDLLDAAAHWSQTGTWPATVVTHAR